mgnify:CR=1 FL=1
MQGRLIVFEGGEGGGKTTQLHRSHQWLIDSGWLALLQTRGFVRQVVMTREPGGTDLGQGLRQILLGHIAQEPICDRTELLLYAADRAQHVEGFLRPLLANGALILCDRYTDSTIAYQGYGRGLDRTLIDQLNHIATNGLQSDLTVWLDLDADLGLARTQKRGASDRIEQADQAFHHRVRQGFAALAQQHTSRIVRVDASLSEEDVSAQIQKQLSAAFVRWYGVDLRNPDSQS